MEHDILLYGRNLQEFRKKAMPSYLAYSSTLKMVEALIFSITSINSNVLYNEFEGIMFL